MWMAELASRSGLTVPTIKYYLREGLLPPGETVGATRTRYDASHVRRLRLVRALTDVAGLSLDTVRDVLAGIDRAGSWHDAVGAAHTRLGGDGPAPTRASIARVERMLEIQGWSLAPDHPHLLGLARALDTLDAVGHPLPDLMVDLYAHALRPLAMQEVRSVRMDDDGALIEVDVEGAVVGTVLVEPVILAIRRIAQENVSRMLDSAVE